MYITREIFLFKIHPEIEAGRLVPDLILFFEKALDGVKASGQQLSFSSFRKPSTCYAVKTNCIKLLTIDPEICLSLIF